MKETIYYTSTLKWFNHASGRYSSKQQALKTHLEYVIKSKDFRFADGDKNYILERSKLADKRVNSRIAFSFVFALPNDLNEEQIKDWIKNIKGIICKHFDMDERDLFIGYHDSIGVSGIKNCHLHIVGTNLTKDNKGVRIQIRTLKEFQKDLQGFVMRQGYVIRKNEDGPEEKIGVRLRYDEEAKQDYLEYIETKKAYSNIMKKIQQKEIVNENQPKNVGNIQKSTENIPKSMENTGKISENHLKSELKISQNTEKVSENLTKNNIKALENQEKSIKKQQREYLLFYSDNYARDEFLKQYENQILQQYDNIKPYNLEEYLLKQDDYFELSVIERDKHDREIGKLAESIKQLTRNKNFCIVLSEDYQYYQIIFGFDLDKYRIYYRPHFPDSDDDYNPRNKFRFGM